MTRAAVTRFDGDTWVDGEVKTFVKLGSAGNSTDEWTVEWQQNLGDRAATSGVDDGSESVVARQEPTIDAHLLERLLVTVDDRQRLRATRSYKNSLNGA